MRRVYWIGGVSLALSACLEFDNRAPNTCGNDIVEAAAGEDCDGADGCIGPGNPNACWWACSADSPCPEGFGCGQDGVCRSPGYELERGPTVGEGKVAWIEAADLDADGRDDLVIVHAEAGQTTGDLSVVFSGAGGAPEKTLTWERLPARVSVGDADGDGLPDLLLTGNSQWVNSLPAGDGSRFAGFSLLRNDGDRGFSAVMAPENWGPAVDPGGWFFPPNQEGDVVELLVDGGTLSRPDEDGGWHPLWEVEALNAAKSAVAFGESSGGADPEGYNAPVVALTGAPVPGSPAHFGPDLEACHWSEEWSLEGCEPLGLYGGASVWMHPWVGFWDLDSDGFPEVFAQRAAKQAEPSSANAIVYAWGAGYGRWHGEDEAVEPDDADMTLGETLVSRLGPAGGLDAGRVLEMTDINADGAPDFIYEGMIAISRDEPYSGQWEPSCGEGHACWQLSDAELEPWTRALAVDTNRDGQLEVVGIPASGGNNVVVLRGGPGGWGSDDASWAPSHVPGVPVELRASDVDADGYEDLLVRLEGEGHKDDGVYVNWGSNPEFDLRLLIDGVELHEGVNVGGDFNEGSLQLTAAGDPGDAERALATSVLFAIADSLVAWGIEPDPTQEENSNGWYQHALAGHFSAADASELALVGAAVDNTLSGSLAAISDQAQTARLETAPGGGVNLALDTPWAVEATPGFGETQPPLTSVAAHHEALDLDGDGRDELVVVGPLAPNFAAGEILLGGGTFVAVYEHDGDQWAARSQVANADAEWTFGGRWPYSRARHAVEFEDLDGDGHVDLLAVGRDAQDEVVAVVSLGGDGALGSEESTLVSPSGPSWDALSLLGPAAEGSRRVATVADDLLEVNALDLEGGALDPRFSVEAPKGTTWSTTGDFNGDGLPDLALATDNGVVLYLGVAAHVSP